MTSIDFVPIGMSVAISTLVPEIVGAKITDNIAPRQIYRLAIAERRFPLAVWTPDWQSQVGAYVEGIPACGLGFIIGAPAIDTSRNVAVLDFRVATVLSGTGSVSLGALLRKLADYFPGAEITRVTRVDQQGSEVIRNTELELQGEISRETTRDETTGLRGLWAEFKAILQKGFITVLVVVALVALAYLLLTKYAGPKLGKVIAKAAA